MRAAAVWRRFCGSSRAGRQLTKTRARVPVADLLPRQGALGWRGERFSRVHWSLTGSVALCGGLTGGGGPQYGEKCEREPEQGAKMAALSGPCRIPLQTLLTPVSSCRSLPISPSRRAVTLQPLPTAAALPTRQDAPPAGLSAAQMAVAAGRPAPSLPHKLEALQRSGRAWAPLFTAVPLSGRVPIEDVLDEAAEMKSAPGWNRWRLGCFCAICWRLAACLPPPRECIPAPPHTTLPCAGAVLLGFTRDGGHLVSYTSQPVAAADGAEGYALQLWRFEPGQRCRRLWSVPLFRWVLGAGCRSVPAFRCGHTQPPLDRDRHTRPSHLAALTLPPGRSHTWMPWRMRSSSCRRTAWCSRWQRRPTPACWVRWAPGWQPAAWCATRKVVLRCGALALQ